MFTSPPPRENLMTVKLKNGRVLENKCRVRQSAKLLAARKAAKKAHKKMPSKRGKHCTVQSAQYKLSHHRKGGAKRKSTGKKVAVAPKTEKGFGQTVLEMFNAIPLWFYPDTAPRLSSGGSSARQLGAGSSGRQLGPGGASARASLGSGSYTPPERQLAAGR